MPRKGTRLSVIGRFGFRRPSPATVIAVIALSVAIGGSATAAVVSGGGSGKDNGTASAAKAKKKRTSKGQRTIRLVGPKGQIGDQGPQGAAGPQGPAGEGSLVPGPQGDTGETGAKGNTGNTGDKGATGATGEWCDPSIHPECQGPPGLNGDTATRYAARITDAGVEVDPTYSNGTAPTIKHDAAGVYEIGFTGDATTHWIASATATIQDDPAGQPKPAFISTQVRNTDQVSVVTVTVRAPNMTALDLPFAVQVLMKV